VRIAIDDFGTGYSALSYLKRLPVDVLKIDRSFVCDVTTDPVNATITETIVQLARGLGLTQLPQFRGRFSGFSGTYGSKSALHFDPM
jgi:sensor c-di-GMP phosphodiesterase-like protein